MKRFFGFIALVILSVSLVGCASSEAPDNSGKYETAEEFPYVVRYHVPRMLFKHHAPQGEVYYSGRISDSKLWAVRPYPRATGPQPYYEVDEETGLMTRECTEIAKDAERDDCIDIPDFHPFTWPLPEPPNFTPAFDVE